MEEQDGQPGDSGTAPSAGELTGQGAPDRGGQADARKALVQRLRAARARVTSREEHRRPKRDLIEHAWVRQPDAQIRAEVPQKIYQRHTAIRS